MYDIIKFMTIRYKLTASGIIIHSKHTFKHMKSVSILRTQKYYKKTGENSKFKKIERDKYPAKSH